MLGLPVHYETPDQSSKRSLQTQLFLQDAIHSSPPDWRDLFLHENKKISPYAT